MGITTSYKGIEEHGKKIRIVFMHDGERCREVINLEPTPANMKKAFQLRERIIKKIAEGSFDYAEYFPESKRVAKLGLAKKDNITFSKLLEQYYAYRTDWAEWTRYSSKLILNNFWFEKLGDIPVKHISFNAIKQALDDRDFTNSNTHFKYANTLSTFLKFAIDEKVITENPVDRLKFLKKPDVEPMPFKKVEMDAIMNHMREFYEPYIVNFFGVAFYTGLRTQELLALKWDDIDFERGRIRVCQAMGKGEIKDTKTGNIRYVEMNSAARNHLESQKQITSKFNSFVFISLKFKKPYLTGSSFLRNFWQPTLKALKIEARPMYNTRHTFATFNLMAGANPMWVAKQLGHKGLKTMFKHYAKWLDDAEFNQVGKINAILQAGA